MPVIVRYRGLILAVLVAFGILIVLAIPAMIAVGRWPLAIVAVVSLVATMILYGTVKDYR